MGPVGSPAGTGIQGGGGGCNSGTSVRCAKHEHEPSARAPALVVAPRLRRPPVRVRTRNPWKEPPWTVEAASVHQGPPSRQKETTGHARRQLSDPRGSARRAIARGDRSTGRNRRHLELPG